MARAVLALLFALGSAAAAAAQETPTIAAYTVPEGCPDAAAFAERLRSLGAVPGRERLGVEVAPAWSGLLRGVVVIEADGRARVERVIEEEDCADVLDALAISAALVLRAGLPVAPPAEAPPLPPPPVAAPPPPPPPRSSIVVRGFVGAGLRVGLGPTPGLSAAPELAGGLEIDRFALSLRAAFFPEASAPPGGASVALFAVTGALELGGRIGDALALVPAAVVEAGAAVARGVSVERPRTEGAFTLDLGLALTGLAELGSLRLWARVDLLFAAVRPAYLVEGGQAFEPPAVRGTGTVGVAYVLGP